MQIALKLKPDDEVHFLKAKNMEINEYLQQKINTTSLDMLTSISMFLNRPENPNNFIDSF